MIAPVHRRRPFSTVAALGLLASIAIAGGWAFNGRGTLNDVTVPLGEGAVLRIGQLQLPSRLALITPAYAAENVTLRDVTISYGEATYRMSRIEIVGSTLGQPDLTALLDKNNPRPLAERLSLLTAASATIPEIVIEYPRLGGRQTITGRDLVLRTIAAGKIGAMTMAAGTTRGPAPDDAVGFSAVTVEDIDLVAATRLFADIPGADNKEPDRIIGSLIWNEVNSRSATGGLIRADRVALTDFRARSGALKSWPAIHGPLLGSIAIAGVMADIPDPKIKGERWKWRLKNLVLAADQPRKGLPSHLQAALQEFSIELDPKSERSRNFREMGYERFETSLSFEGNWDEPASEFVVKNIALDITDVGSVTLEGKLGSVTKDVFAGDAAASGAARSRITVKSFDIVFENRGLYEHAVARDAKKDGKSIEEVRREFANRAAKAFPVALGGSPTSRILSAAVADFAKQPKLLVISAKAKNPAGIALGDFAGAAGNTGEILEKLDLKATAR